MKKMTLSMLLLLVSAISYAESDRLLCTTIMESTGDFINRHIAREESITKKEYEIVNIAISGGGLRAGGYMTCVSIREKK